MLLRRDERHDARGGTIFFLALVLMTLIMVALFTAFFLVAEDRQSTVHVVKTVRSTAIAESMKAFVVAQVNSAPWERRFYLLDARSSPIIIDGTEMPEVFFPFFDTDSTFMNLVPPADRPHISFHGVIKDIDALARRYRIWVEIVYMGHLMAFSFDKAFSEDLLGALNHDPNTLARSTLEPDIATTNPLTGTTVGDPLIDAIVNDALTPAKLTYLAALYADLAKYRRQEPLRYLKPTLEISSVLPTP